MARFAGPRTLSWRPDAPLWLDVAVFEQALEEGRLEDAVETYKGELVEGSYDEWLPARPPAINSWTRNRRRERSQSILVILGLDAVARR
jgi:hypothetical protein